MNFELIFIKQEIFFPWIMIVSPIHLHKLDLLIKVNEQKLFRKHYVQHGIK